MEKYKLSFKKSVAKDLRKIPNKDVQKILIKIKELQSNPRSDGCIKLSGQERYRFRHGIYRVVYEILDSELIILVVKVARRGQVIKNS